MSFTFDIRELDGTCGCCAGGTSGVGYLCAGCLTAVRRQDRLGHPHELSQAQRELIGRKGPTGGGIDVVDALVYRDEGGTETVLGYMEVGSDD